MKHNNCSDKCLAFDLGRVLFDFDYTIALNKWGEKIGVPIDKIITELFHNDFAADFEKGLISSDDFYEKFKKEFTATMDYGEFVNIWSDIFSPKKEMLDLVEKVVTFYPTYLISNINELHFEHLHKGYPHIFSLFDGLILSYVIKSIKPERKIYEELKKLSNKEYENIVYIDDRPDLITPAKKLGLDAIQFITYDKLIPELNNRDILPV